MATPSYTPTRSYLPQFQTHEAKVREAERFVGRMVTVTTEWPDVVQGVTTGILVGVAQCASAMRGEMTRPPRRDLVILTDAGYFTLSIPSVFTIELAAV